MNGEREVGGATNKKVNLSAAPLRFDRSALSSGAPTIRPGPCIATPVVPLSQVSNEGPGDLHG